METSLALFFFFFLRVGEQKVSKFPVTWWFHRMILCSVYREFAWYRESLQRRKAFEKLLPVSLPPLHCTFVSFSPLTPSFSLSPPVIPGVAHEVTMFLCMAAGLCGLLVVFVFFLLFFVFFLFCTSHMYFSILGSPFSTPPQRESPHWKAFLLIMWAVTLKHYSHTQSEWHNMVSWQVKNTICASELVCDRVSDSKLRYFIAASV